MRQLRKWVADAGASFPLLVGGEGPDDPMVLD